MYKLYVLDKLSSTALYNLNIANSSNTEHYRSILQNKLNSKIQSKKVLSNQAVLFITSLTMQYTVALAFV